MSKQRPEGDSSGLFFHLEVVILANAENLKGKGLDHRTPSEQREIARKGGQASGAARRLKKMRRVAAEMLADMPVADNELRRKMELLGVPEEDRTYQMAVVMAMLIQALKGNVNAAGFLRDTIGEGPGDQLRREKLKLSKARFEYEKVGTEKEKVSLAEAIQAAYEERKRRGGPTPSRDDDGGHTEAEGA